jgi:serine/threonine protein kinase
LSVSLFVFFFSYIFGCWEELKHYLLLKRKTTMSSRIMPYVNEITDLELPIIFSAALKMDKTVQVEGEKMNLRVMEIGVNEEVVYYALEPTPERDTIYGYCHKARRVQPAGLDYYETVDNQWFFVKKSDLNRLINGLEVNSMENPLREIAAIQQLQRVANSHQLMREIHSCVSNNDLFLVMPYHPSSINLSQWLARQETVSIDAIRRIIYQFAIGISHLHHAGFAHRDLSPENAILNENGSHVIIIDFGMIVRCDSDHHHHHHHLPWYGKEAYRCPEAKGIVVENYDVSQYDPRKADVWALGAILYKMFTGKVLFAPGPPQHDQTFFYRTMGLRGLLFHCPTRREEKNLIPNEFLSILVRMLAVNPDERYSIDDVLQHAVFESL